MTAVRLSQITNDILKGVDLEIGTGELVVMVGPSGAGKTTLLNVIAGFVQYRGQVLFDAAPVDCIPTHRRKVGYVFQELMLFPHLSLEKSLRLSMRAQKIRHEEWEERSEELMRLLKIGHLKCRLPVELSAGERQRAALARALACRPRILLMDEPFSNLDFQTAGYLRREFKALHRNLDLTTLFVTHNIREAEELADRIALMSSGRIQKIFQAGELMMLEEKHSFPGWHVFIKS
jgi:ABC-type sugar transport system ATPase subunit